MTTPADFVAALQRKDRLAAIAAAQALLAARAPLGDQWRGIGQFAASSGEWSLAIAAMGRFAAAGQPRDPERVLALADILAQAGRAKEAAALVEPAVRTAPNDARLHHLLGTVRIQLGDAGRGLESLEAAARLWPGSGMTWLAIAGARNYRDDDAGLADLRAAEAAIGASPAERAPYLYALGKAHGDRAESDPAFVAIAEGARLARALRPHDSAADLSSALAMARAFPRDLLDSMVATATSGDAPIFVTGLPRSGTTLVEQMLASHSAVRGGGEVNLMGLAAEVIGGASPDAIRKAAAGPDSERALQGVRERYLHLAAERQPGTGRFIDKSLNTSRFAALVRLAMPDARLIWLRRDPLDTAWSAFSTYFSRGVAWSFDQVSLAAHFAAEDLLFEHWQDALGDRLLAVHYDELVGGFDAAVPAILNHVGLASEPGVFAFHETTRAVSTASVAQVRQPVYGHAVGRAEPYRAHLAPFTEAYAKARSALGLES